MKMFKAMFIANVKEYIRDKAALFWMLVFPLIFIFIFGWVFTGGSEQSFNIGIVVKSDNMMNQQMVETFKGIESFNVYIEEENEETELKALKEGRRSLVFKLPDSSYQEIEQGNKIEIPVYYDAGKQQTNQILMSVLNQVFNGIERKISGQPKLFRLKTRSIQVEELNDFDYILPGILAMALMQLGLFGSIQFLSLREKKIIRGLGVTPLSRFSILSSEVLLRLIMGLIQAVLILTIGSLVFDVTIVGSILQLAGLVVLGSLTFISLGYMLICFVNSVDAGQNLLQVVQFPMMFLSGVFFPYEMMPDFMQPIVKILPLTYLGDALRTVTTGFSTNYSLMTCILVLSGWLLLSFVMTIKLWKWD